MRTLLLGRSAGHRRVRLRRHRPVAHRAYPVPRHDPRHRSRTPPQRPGLLRQPQHQERGAVGERMPRRGFLHVDDLGRVVVHLLDVYDEPSRSTSGSEDPGARARPNSPVVNGAKGTSSPGGVRKGAVAVERTSRVRLRPLVGGLGHGQHAHSLGECRRLVVRDDGRILAVQRRDNGRWEPPGGSWSSPRPSTTGCVARWSRRPACTSRSSGSPASTRTWRGGSSCWCSVCRPAAGEPTTTDEARRVDWLTPEEVRELMAPAYAVRVLDALGRRRRHASPRRVSPDRFDVSGLLVVTA
jgi:8-oxo-dGTP diphosphatase